MNDLAHYLTVPSLLMFLQIIWIDILLSGDNAVVIALACRSLPKNQQRLGIALGAGTAVLLRIVFATLITFLLAVPYLKIVGGLMLLWIAIKLVQAEEEEEKHITAKEGLLAAVGTIAVADVVMSLDNVVAIAGVSQGDILLFAFGLIVSIPLVVTGASLITGLITRFPILVWAGGALLGWVAGEMIVTDPFVAKYAEHHGDVAHYASAAIGAVIVIAVGYLLFRISAAKARKQESAA